VQTAVTSGGVNLVFRKGIVMFNNLDDNIKFSNSINIFKGKVKRFIVQGRSVE